MLEAVAIAACQSWCMLGESQPQTCTHSFIHSHTWVQRPCPGVAHSLTASGQISQELWPGRGCCFVCLGKERSSAFLPRYQPQGLSLRPSPHTPAPSLGPSSPRLNTSRLGLLVLFLKVCPPLIHPLLPRPHILVKVPQRQLGQTTGASPHPSSAAAL